MRTLLRGAAVLLTMATATFGLALPSAAAPAAQSAFPCPLILAVCAYDTEGSLRLIVDDEPDIRPPVLWAANNTPDFWCFYNWPGYGGERREVGPGEVVHDFGFRVRAARRGLCYWS
ncbi:hypothetical protein [Nonomuraea jiangxiensis]|uniref:Peptidase inhibitor family I36 n=1 Tax=Nonomuraea jiangxiensis TaxID=633440 RepID=A0A1G9C2I2_9ACTN|nr:hypothetical protein [Nonomuraea jiangxiensis]SDK45664.1 hypothetical protein SAMN05421869_11645 [Nonomuraea jiangxiensis]